MQRQIKMVFNVRTGEVKTEAVGFQGSACVASAAFLHGLGDEVIEYKAEYFQDMSDAQAMSNEY